MLIEEDTEDIAVENYDRGITPEDLQTGLNMEKARLIPALIFWSQSYCPGKQTPSHHSVASR